MRIEWIIFFAFLSNTCILGDRAVSTYTGKVRGITVHLPVGEDVVAFLGIPFAEPPVGKLRFEKPVPITPWEGEYNATNLPPPCYQNYTMKFYWTPNVERMSEDCLYLNIWVPGSLQDTKPKPVFLWIHGGAFSHGSSEMDIYNGARLASRGNIIVASINYRVGLFGFFTTTDPDYSGNMGLKDQIMAVKWIKTNVKAFGGDPELMTLAGESAGAISVSQFLVSPETRGLVKRVVLESGGMVNPIMKSMTHNLLKVAERVASATGCSSRDVNVTSNPKFIVDCLKRQPPNVISEAEGYLFKIFAVTSFLHSDGVLVPRDLVQMMADGHFQDTEVLLGGVKDEGSLFITVALPNVFGIYGANAPILKKRLSGYLIRTVLKMFHQENTEPIAKFYLEGSGNRKTYSETDDDVDYMKTSLYDSVGDFIIFCPTVFQADFMSTKSKPVYFYLFTHRPSTTVNAEWVGVTHFDEVPFVFGRPLDGDKNYTDEDKEISKSMMDRWIAFVKTGNPNIPGEVEWPPYKWYDPVYLDIGVKQKVGKRPDNYRCEFWRDRFGASMDPFKTEAITNKAPREKSFYILVITYFLFVKTLTK